MARLARLRRSFVHVVTGPAVLGPALAGTMTFDFLLLHQPYWQLPLTALQTGLSLIAMASAFRRDRSLNSSEQQLRRYVYHALVALVAAIAVAEKWQIVTYTDVTARAEYAASYRVMGAAITLCGILSVLGRGERFLRFFVAFAQRPARQMAASFAGLALFGAFLLTLPVCVRDASQVSFLDSLFMATSAVCVTGLAVHGVATTYTHLGQIVLLALVQLGGLGIMVLSASLSILAGRKLRAKSSMALAEMLDTESMASLRGNILRIVGFTLVIEAIGALALYVALSRFDGVALSADADHPMAGAGSLAWSALFHAVSAFCNAGFSLSRDGLIPFVGASDVCGIVMVLILLGGIGFPVLSELSSRTMQRVRGVRPLRVTLHTRVALLSSLALVVGIALFFGVTEWQGAFGHLSWPKRVLAALFQSVTLRTAGFNTVDFAHFSSASLMVCCLFMFIGASPGGTGGGVKTTTFAVLFAAFRAELRGGADPSLLDRRLPESTVRRAVAVGFVAAVLLTGLVLALLLTEEHPPLSVLFEAVSAFGTVGLSTGITADISKAGKLVLILTMLIGRVGPLTLALAASERATRVSHQRPQERVLIG